MDTRTFNTFAGAMGELGFYWLLKEEYRKVVKEWGLKEGRYTSAYDLVISGKEKDHTIDVKTSIIGDSVKGPEDCNFIWNWSSANRKKKAHIPFCDYYIQMLYYPEKEAVVYVGAVSQIRINEYEDKIRKWDATGKGASGYYGKIFHENMDLTAAFLDCIDDKYKLIISS